jgi:two-component system chemotaxis response regulator CheY
MDEVMPAKDNGYSEPNALPGGIIMIDDDEVMHFLFKVLMKKYKPELSVQTYSEAKKVLRLLEDNSFQGSVIMLDLNMPFMNGWQFLQELERLGHRIPVYILSSSDSAADKSRASKFRNVKGYFVKPLNIEHINIIESGLGQHE